MELLPLRKSALVSSRSSPLVPARVIALPPRPRQRRVYAVGKTGDSQELAAIARLANPSALDEAARTFRAGLESGLNEDYLVALELGAGDLSELTDLQKQYKDKIKEKLLKRVIQMKKEETELRNKLSKNFDLGKKAYGMGEYPASVTLFETAVEELDAKSALGGEAQMWLALAYQACGREQDCIDLYKSIESNHPMGMIKRKAANLRYIMEAPKLEIGADERVQIPLLQTDTWRKDRKGGYNTQRVGPPKEKKGVNYWDKVNWDVASPSFIPDKWYVRVAWIVLLVGVTVYGNLALS